MSTFDLGEAKPWHSIESDHWDLQFEDLPGRIPWFTGDDLPPLTASHGGDALTNQFPMSRL